MKKLTPKVDNTGGATGQYIANEFNNFHEEAQNVVTETGQTLSTSLSEDTDQLLMGIAVGGARKILTTGSTAKVGQIVLPDNSSAAVTITLPPVADLFVNATVEFEQIFDSLYSTFSLTIARNGQLIMGKTEDFVLNSQNSDNTKIKMIWLAGFVGWNVSLVETIGEAA